MIRLRAQVNTKPIDDLVVFANDFTRLAVDLGARAFREIEDGLLDELRFYPPPIPTSTYIRTFRLRDGWRLGLEATDNGFALTIANETPYTKYVAGSLAQARAAAARLQAQIHRGRWPLAHDTVDFWLDAFQETYDQLFAQELARFGTSSTTRRAFTR